MSRRRLAYFGIPLFIGLAVSGLSACAPELGPSIETPELAPIALEKNPKFALRHMEVNVTGVKDQRLADVSRDVTPITEPAGDVEPEVETAIIKALRGQGVVVSETSPLFLSAEIRKWQTKVTATSSGYIESEAVLSAKVTDSRGKEIYTGMYHGNSSSRAPVFTLTDAKESLAKAMTQAITQFMEDEQLLRALSSY